MSDLRSPIIAEPSTLPTTHRPRVGNTEDGFVYLAGSGNVGLTFGNKGYPIIVVAYVDLETDRVHFISGQEFNARFEEVPHP